MNPPQSLPPKLRVQCLVFDHSSGASVVGSALAADMAPFVSLLSRHVRLIFFRASKTNTDHPTDVHFPREGAGDSDSTSVPG